MALRILLADDHRLLRESLRSMLEAQPDMEVVGDAADGRAAITRVKALHPDIVLMDVSMPGLNGIEATRQLRAQHPGVQVIALSMHRDVRTIGRMLAAGARGYLLKDCSSEVLLEAIDAVAAGGRYIDPELLDTVLTEYMGRFAAQPDPPPHSPLSPREREVLQLLVETGSTEETAAALGLSPKTVETHRCHIKEKLGIDHMPGLTKYAIREGLTSLGD